MNLDKQSPYCSFCGKNHNDVLMVVAGPNVYICDECILICNEIVYEESRKNGKELKKLEVYLNKTHD